MAAKAASVFSLASFLLLVSGASSLQLSDTCEWIGATGAGTPENLLVRCDGSTDAARRGDPAALVRCRSGRIPESLWKSDLFRNSSAPRGLSIEGCATVDFSDGVFGNLRNLTVRAGGEGRSEIPQLSGLTGLERMDLSFGRIAVVSSGSFCGLPRLGSVNVSHNEIDEAGARFSTRGDSSCRPRVETLDMSHNRLRAVPERAFSSLSALVHLILQSNGVTLLEKGAFESLASLRLLDMSRNSIVSLPVKLFDSQNKIRSLLLSGNLLESVPLDALEQLKSLVILDLSNNRLSLECDFLCRKLQIVSNSFPSLTNLAFLNLSHNRITSIKPNYFRELSNLQVLDLSHNLLSSIGADSFSASSKLHTLSLSHNRIHSFSDESLRGLIALRSVKLDSNNISYLNPNVFQNLSLHDLYLNDNKFATVPLALSGLGSLRMLEMGGNQIRELDNHSFQGLTSLTSLTLNDNRISRLSGASFRKIPSLKILNLSQNRLVSVDRGSFDMNKNLQALRLDSNMLDDVVGVFNNLPNLAWLNISDNVVSKFDFFLIPHGLKWLDLHKNNIAELGNYFDLQSELELHTLDVSLNRLKTLSPKMIPENVQFLFLNDNQITEIQPHSFLTKRSLKRVDLYANKIEKLEMNALRLSPANDSSALPNFYLGGNPFICDCSLEWLQRINEENTLQHPIVKDLESIYCKLIYSRQNAYIPLVNAKTSDFLCTYKTHCYALCHCCDFDACDCEMTCPRNCTCYHDQSWASNIVECSDSKFTRSPSGIPMDATHIFLDGNDFGELSSHLFIGRKILKILFLNNSNIINLFNHTFSGLDKLQRLHLENNLLSELRGYEFENLYNLQELYLQDNRIDRIRNGTFSELSSLQVLRLDGNRLKTFSFWQLSSNSYLIELDLQRNAWTCSCPYVLEMKDWLAQNLARVRDGERLMCRDSAGSERAIAISDFGECISTGETATLLESKLFHDYLPLLIVSVSALLIFLSATGILMYFRRDIKQYIHAFCVFGLKCKKSKKTYEDLNKVYDAFVAYSVKDESFVAEVLSRELERRGDALDTYRLCLQHRDFSVGADTAEAVVEASEKSHRTIVVLTDSFLVDEWSDPVTGPTLEFLLTKLGRQVIVIQPQGVSLCQSHEGLRAALSRATFIRWNEVLFWKKLKSGLPRARPRPIVSVCDIGGLSTYEVNHPLPLPPPPPPISLTKLYQQRKQHGSSACGKIYESLSGVPHPNYERISVSQQKVYDQTFPVPQMWS